MRKCLLLLLAFAWASTAHAVTKPTHGFISGPFQSGPDVTRTCMECHEKLTKEIMSTVHWNWGKKQPVKGTSTVYGKKNALGNSLCLALPSNESGCTSCHAGYGWADAGFDFKDPQNVDCLVCHDTTGAYKKFPYSSGHPVYPGETKEFPAGKVWEAVDLVAAARSVDRPSRTACGACHFYGGGGDGYKHGDLDSSLANPPREMDIHMGGKGMTCESCHKAANHDVRGEAISVSLSSAPRAFGCTDCHKGNLHKFRILNKHMKRVACQACHIPTFARATPTVMSWDWSAAGRDLKPEEAKQAVSGGKLYDKNRGELTLGKELIPTYLWYNGAIDRVLLGDRIDPGSVVKLSAPKGSRKDPDARLFPFKIMTAKQPYDAENMTVAVVNFYGPGSETAYWEKFDWNKAIEAGMKAAGQPYSGKYGWVETSTAWSLNHMVVPKEQALRCHGCHGEKGRIDWKALGYPKDPR